MRRLVYALIPLLIVASLGSSSFASEVSAAAVIQEMNVARQNPAVYAEALERVRANYHGRFILLPGQTKVVTHEGVHAVDEAISFLRAVRPLQPLILSPGMCRGTADHCAEQVGGEIGHGNPVGRMNRYGTWGTAWGENISYGQRSARDIVLALIIDDGLPARKHRANIFASKFNYAGAAYGPHARYGSVCTIDFAGAYFERDGQTTLVAKSN